MFIVLMSFVSYRLKKQQQQKIPSSSDPSSPSSPSSCASPPSSLSWKQMTHVKLFNTVWHLAHCTQPVCVLNMRSRVSIKSWKKFLHLWKSPPQNHLGRAHCYPHGRQCTCPLRVLLAAKYPLQTNPITQLRLCYIYMAMPHVSHT